MSPNRRTKASSKPSEARNTPPPSKSAKDVRSREELRRERDEVVESRRIRRAIRAEFEEAQARGIGVGETTRKENVHTSESPILSGGDIDADWKRADVGEETVGGTVSTPDQDVVDELGEAAGVEYADNEPLDPEEKILRRDRERWELNPASSESFQENQREQDEEFESSPRPPSLARNYATPKKAAQAAAANVTPPTAQARTAKKPAVGSVARKNASSGQNASGKTAAARNTPAKPPQTPKGKQASTKPAAAKRTQTGRGKQR